MMASLSEQRRFLQQIQTVQTKKLLQIKKDLLEINEKTEQDMEFLRKIDIELQTRD